MQITLLLTSLCALGVTFTVAVPTNGTGNLSTRQGLLGISTAVAGTRDPRVTIKVLNPRVNPYPYPRVRVHSHREYGYTATAGTDSQVVKWQSMDHTLNHNLQQAKMSVQLHFQLGSGAQITYLDSIYQKNAGVLSYLCVWDIPAPGKAQKQEQSRGWSWGFDGYFPWLSLNLYWHWPVGTLQSLTQSQMTFPTLGRDPPDQSATHRRHSHVKACCFYTTRDKVPASEVVKYGNMLLGCGDAAVNKMERAATIVSTIKGNFIYA
ncbi:hypothetical protein C8F01DRAFT_1231845 [Mycena amicta]|nr:hypothetical protein C8F01DRAFT_1231845 [Mycena amicta]